MLIPLLQTPLSLCLSIPALIASSSNFTSNPALFFIYIYIYIYISLTHRQQTFQLSAKHQKYLVKKKEAESSFILKCPALPCHKQMKPDIKHFLKLWSWLKQLHPSLCYYFYTSMSRIVFCNVWENYISFEFCSLPQLKLFH